MHFQVVSSVVSAFAGHIASVIVNFVYVDFRKIVVRLKALYLPDYLH